MIFFVDEDVSALGAWLLKLEQRGHSVIEFRNADTAFASLCSVRPEDVQLVIIDVMLAVSDPETTRFGAARTDAYLETGLCLLQDLCPQNPAVFPDRAVLLTNTSIAGTFDAAVETSNRFGFRYGRSRRCTRPAISPIVWKRG